jgi:hypothetical protein
LEELVRFLESGLNVVGTAGYITGKYLGENAVARLDAAAKRGGASLYGSGINPGLSNILALVGSGLCDRIYSVSVTESVDVTDYASPGTWERLGWAKPLGAPGQDLLAQSFTQVLLDALDMTADALGIELDEREHDLEFAVTKERLELPYMTFPKNTVAGQKMTYHGMANGRSVIRQNIVYKIRAELEPDWPLENGYLIEVEGEPSFKIKLQLTKPQVQGVNREKSHMASGMVATAMPAVNAIPHVCSAAPGVRTAADLPLITARGQLF